MRGVFKFNFRIRIIRINELLFYFLLICFVYYFIFMHVENTIKSRQTEERIIWLEFIIQKYKTIFFFIIKTAFWFGL